MTAYHDLATGGLRDAGVGDDLALLVRLELLDGDELAVLDRLVVAQQLSRLVDATWGHGVRVRPVVIVNAARHKCPRR
jgi:hypothetical protein